MTGKERENWRSQMVTSNSAMRVLRYAPFCFTEQGLAMLSSILNSETAIRLNVQIIRICTKMQALLLSYKDILLKLEKTENRRAAHDEDITGMLKYLKQLLNPPQPTRCKIGFRRKNEQE